jgi:hypothetical protein
LATGAANAPLCVLIDRQTFCLARLFFISDNISQEAHGFGLHRVVF